MSPVRKIPVSEKIRTDLSELKRPEQTFEELLLEMAEHEKKTRLASDMKRIEKHGDFIEMSFDA